MTKIADDRYLAPSEVAHLLNVSKWSVYQGVRAGHPAAYPDCGRVAP